MARLGAELQGGQCVCLSADPYECARMRTGNFDDDCYPCECDCHDDGMSYYDEDEDDGE